jgi:hypothetical protein
MSGRAASWRQVPGWLLAVFLLFTGPGAAQAQSLKASTSGSIVPVAAKGQPALPVNIADGAATFTVASGTRRFVYNWTPGAAGGGTVSMHQAGSTGLPTVVRYAPTWAGAATVVGRAVQKRNDDVVLRETFDVDRRRVTISTRLRVVARSLTIAVEADQPALVALQMMPPDGPGLIRELLPYSPVDAYRSAVPPRFYSAVFDWTQSAATTFENNSAVYKMRTDGTRNILRERLILTMSDSVISVMPVSPWARSRFYDRVGGRMMVDVYETLPFADIATQFEGLIAAGLRDCVLIVHVWQRLGYDNGLPMVLPANDYLGGGDVIRRIAKRAADVGCLFALHQNYIDYYPNAEGFDPSLIALDGNGKRLDAWFNSAVGIGSFTVKPRAFALLASRIAPEIHRTLGTTASFIDVNSGYLPWQRVDMDAREADGGRFSAFVDGSKELFETMQGIEDGPVFGEGHHNFYSTGAVDGVAAQLTVGNRGDVRTTPMWIDFALRRIRPLQHNFGMGFYDRYAPALLTSRDPLADEDNRDIYRTQQLAFGHMPYRSGILWGDARLFVQEAALSGAVAQKVAASDVVSIHHRLGDRWLPIEDVMQASRPLPVRIRYANGIVLTANTSAEAVTDGQGVALVRAEWSAIGPAILARSSGGLVGRRDYVRSRSMIYADPRNLPGNWAGEGEPADLVDFGVIRTDGQVWSRCVAGRWHIIAFARRGNVEVEVDRRVIRTPTILKDANGQSIRPTIANDRYWRIQLISGKNYVLWTKCTS